MRSKALVALSAAATIGLASPAEAYQAEPQPVLSHGNLDRLENHLGLLGLIGLIGLFGLRRREKR